MNCSRWMVNVACLKGFDIRVIENALFDGCWGFLDGECGFSWDWDLLLAWLVGAGIC